MSKTNVCITLSRNEIAEALLQIYTAKLDLGFETKKEDWQVKFLFNEKVPDYVIAELTYAN